MVPLTSCGPAGGAGVIGGSGFFPAAAVSRHVVVMGEPQRADRCAGFGGWVGIGHRFRLRDRGGQVVAVISAQRNPASSRAIAVATTVLTFLRAARRRNRALSRCWAAQDRATVCGGTPCWRVRSPTPTAGRCW